MKIKSIVIPYFPTERFTAYVKRAGASSAESLTLEQKQHVFLMAISDFYEYGLSLDELAHVGNRMWASLDDRTTELADAMYAASELSYYIRYADEKSIDVLLDFLTDVKEYFEEYKNILKDQS